MVLWGQERERETVSKHANGHRQTGLVQHMAVKRIFSFCRDFYCAIWLLKSLEAFESYSKLRVVDKRRRER